jgi:hypothetical protein
MLMYLAKYSQTIDSIDFRALRLVRLRELPSDLQISSLLFDGFELQLQPGGGFEGVLGAAGRLEALKQLRLSGCRVLDAGADAGLEAVLSMLPAGLEHLSVDGLAIDMDAARIPTSTLQHLQHLTYLQFVGVCPVGPDPDSPAMQPLQALTRLVELHLDRPLNDMLTITADMLSGMQRLTHLQLVHHKCEQGLLVGLTQLHHVGLAWCDILGGDSEFLSQLESMGHLTHLNLMFSLKGAAARDCSALTASSKLQHLNICECSLPAGVWQHMFPTGRQLLHLTYLDIQRVKWRDVPARYVPAAPGASLLIRCCPNLRYLNAVPAVQRRPADPATGAGRTTYTALGCGWSH